MYCNVITKEFATFDKGRNILAIATQNKLRHFSLQMEHDKICFPRCHSWGCRVSSSGRGSGLVLGRPRLNIPSHPHSLASGHFALLEYKM